MSHPRFLWEVTIGAANNALEFDEGAGALTANLTSADYYLRGGGAAGTDLLQHIAAQMTAAGANTYTLTRSAIGIVTIARSAGVAAFSLHWATGPADTQALAVILGFAIADQGPGTTFSGTDQHSRGWYPGQHLIDGRRRFPVATAGGARSLGNQEYVQQWATDWRAEARIDFVRRARVRYVDTDGTLVGAGTTNQPFTSDGQTWEGLYDAARRGVRFEFHPDEAVIAAAVVQVDPDAGAGWLGDMGEAAELIMEAGERYRITIPMRPWTA